MTVLQAPDTSLDSARAQSAPGATPAPAPDSAAAGAAQAPAADQLLELGAEALGAAQRWIDVQADRSRHALRRSLVRTALTAAIVAATALWSAAALLALLSGVCGAFTHLFGGREWAGQLVGGGLALALALAGLFGALRFDARRQLRALQAKYSVAAAPDGSTP